MTSFLKKVETFLERVDDSVGQAAKATSSSTSQQQRPAPSLPEVDERKVFEFLQQQNKQSPTQQQSAAATAATTTTQASAQLSASVERENELLREEILRQAREIAAIQQKQRILELDLASGQELVQALRSATDAALQEKLKTDELLQAERTTREEGETRARERQLQLEADIGEYSRSLANSKAELQKLQNETSLIDPKKQEATVVQKADKEIQTTDEQNLNLPSNTTTTETIQTKQSEECTKVEMKLKQTEELLQRERKEMEEYQKQMQMKHEELQRQLNMMTNQLKEARENSGRFAKESSEQRLEIGKMRGEIIQLRSKSSEFEAQCEKLKRQLAAKSVLGVEHAQLESRVRTLGDALANSQRRLEDSIRENEKLRNANGLNSDASVIPLNNLSFQQSPPNSPSKPLFVPLDTSQLQPNSNVGFEEQIQRMTDNIWNSTIKKFDKTLKFRIGFISYCIVIHILLIITIILFSAS